MRHGAAVDTAATAVVVFALTHVDYIIALGYCIAPRRAG
jgi:hypothetical protein